MDQMKSHAVKEFHLNESADDFHAEEIRNIGFTVIESELTQDELPNVRERIDEVYRRQVVEIGGEAQLARINDANVGRCLLGYDHYFVGLAAHPRLLSIIGRLLGDYFILMSQNAIINNPANEHYQIAWHRDLNYQHFVSSRPLAISALYAIDDFDEVTGATQVLPASHKLEVFPSTDYVGRHQTLIKVPAGSIILFDSMVFHRTGNNASGKPRRAVNHIYTLPLIRQQISLPRMLGNDYTQDPQLRKLLGYDIETADNTLAWRQNKLKLSAPLR
jgi:ectoine hydroxylase-related dioxygenase (phytanoyl-CoA dioxygenase family)